MAGAGFRGPLLICLLNLTLIVITFIAVCIEVSCLLKFTLATNSGAHTLQFGPAKYHIILDSLWLQIREHTYRNSVMAALYYNGVEFEKMYHTEKPQRTEKAITEAPLIVDGSPG